MMKYAYLLANIGFGTAENEPSKLWQGLCANGKPNGRGFRPGAGGLRAPVAAAAPPGELARRPARPRDAEVAGREACGARSRGDP